jgi:outer membrane lipoprotein-sorting protein
MKPVIAIIFSVITLNCQAQNATEIVRKMDDKMRGKSSQAELTIKTVRPNWSREMLVKSWMKEGHYAMILIQAPAKEKGIVYLKRKKEVWNWIPALERSIKLPPSMMTNSWMGTDFTNDDLVKESSAVDDYYHKIIKDTLIDKRDCYLIEFLPKPNTAVVWGKILVAVDKKDFIEMYSEFYDEEGKLINVMIAHDIRMMDGRLIPTHMEMIPVDKKGQKTELFYRTILFNRNIEESFFTQERMKQLN